MGNGDMLTSRILEISCILKSHPIKVLLMCKKKDFLCIVFFQSILKVYPEKLWEIMVNDNWWVNTQEASD